MPCNCDHMKPDHRERESARVMGFLQEVGLLEESVPYYGNVDKLDKHTAQLCKFCQGTDVTQHSLELQIWWRDHQKHDQERSEREQQEIKDAAAKEAALAKLTDYERGLLGL